MGNPAGVRRDFDGLEQRRMRAAHGPRRKPSRCGVSTIRRAECEQGLKMLEEVHGLQQIMVAPDKDYDTAEFVAGCRALRLSAADFSTSSYPLFVSHSATFAVKWLKRVGYKIVQA